MILGIDEVGRGCWAGPLVVGAVVLGGAEVAGLTDSKKLTKKRRELLYEQIITQAEGVGLGWVSAGELDQRGLSAALCLATERAVRDVEASFHEIIIDGTVNFLRQTSLANHVSLMAKADLLVPSVSAASIVAKVARDRYMVKLSEAYPDYGFAQHVGYGTVAHRAAIEQLGVCPEHRLSFAPLSRYRATPVRQTTAERTSAVSTTRAIGSASERAASQELIRRGHDIIIRNWRTKYCEIDIVSRHDGVYYFTEVKHRKTDWAGDGLAAITPNKLAQMEYAARFYAHVHQLGPVDMRLLAIATTGTDFTIGDVVEADL